MKNRKMSSEKFKFNGRIAALLVIAVVCLILFLTVFGFSLLKSFQVKQAQEIDMQLTVGNYTGFNVNTSALFFGTVVPGGTSKRSINIHNPLETPLKVMLSIEGELSQWALVSNNSFELKPNESREILIEINVPSSAEFGEYNSTFIITFK